MRLNRVLLVAFLALGYLSLGSTFTVTNTNDSGAGSLRQAIIDANGESEIAQIQFNIPEENVSITLLDTLDVITNSFGVSLNGLNEFDGKKVKFQGEVLHFLRAVDSKFIRVSNCVLLEFKFLFNGGYDGYGLRFNNIDSLVIDSLFFGLNEDLKPLKEVGRFYELIDDIAVSILSGRYVCIKNSKFGAVGTCLRVENMDSVHVINSTFGRGYDLDSIAYPYTSMVLFQNSYVHLEALESYSVHGTGLNNIGNFDLEQSYFFDRTSSISINGTSYGVVHDNYFSGSPNYGLAIRDQSGITVENNWFGTSGNSDVEISGKDLIIRNNRFWNKSTVGLNIDDCENCSIYANTFGLDSVGNFSTFKNYAISIGNNRNGTVVSGNVINSSDSAAVVFLSGSRNNYLKNNTITVLNEGSPAVYMTNYYVYTYNYAGGSSEYNKVSQNIIAGGIKHMTGMNEDKVSPSNLTSSYNSSLVISGDSEIEDSVEVFLSDSSGRNAYKFLGRTYSQFGDWQLTIDNSDIDISEKLYFVTTATDGSGNTSEFSEVLYFEPPGLRCDTVTNNNLTGNGSFLEVLECANSNPNFTEIIINIDPEDFGDSVIVNLDGENVGIYEQVHIFRTDSSAKLTLYNYYDFDVFHDATSSIIEDLIIAGRTDEQGNNIRIRADSVVFRENVVQYTGGVQMFADHGVYEDNLIRYNYSGLHLQFNDSYNNLLIRNNIIHDQERFGIDLYGGDSIEVSDNYVYNNLRGAINMPGVTYSQVNSNHFGLDTAYSTYCISSENTSYYGEVYGGYQTGIHDNVFENNVFYSCKTGLVQYGYGLTLIRNYFGVTPEGDSLGISTGLIAEKYDSIVENTFQYVENNAIDQINFSDIIDNKFLDIGGTAIKLIGDGNINSEITRNYFSNIGESGITGNSSHTTVSGNSFNNVSKTSISGYFQEFVIDSNIFGGRDITSSVGGITFSPGYDITISRNTFNYINSDSVIAGVLYRTDILDNEFTVSSGGVNFQYATEVNVLNNSFRDSSIYPIQGLQFNSEIKQNRFGSQTEPLSKGLKLTSINNAIDSNVFYVIDTAVILNGGENTRVTYNYIETEGVSIDLIEEGPTNNDIQVPVIDTVFFVSLSNTLVMSGTTQASKDNIHIYSSSINGQDLLQHVGTVYSTDGTWNLIISDTVISALESHYFVATTTDSLNNTSELSVLFIVEGQPECLTVTNTLNIGTGSFRNAIECANTNPGLDTIIFAISASGEQVITLLDEVYITDPIFIDGFTQTLNSRDITVSTVDSCGSALLISPEASGTFVKGLNFKNIGDDSNEWAIQFYQWGSDSIAIDSCLFENVTNAISVLGGDNIRLSDNTFSDVEYYGIQLISPQNSTISDNLFQRDSIGLDLKSSSHNVLISSNHFLDNKLNAINVAYGDSVFIENNIISGTQGGDGIYLTGGINNSYLKDNYSYNNMESGLHIDGFSTDLFVENNTFGLDESGALAPNKDGMKVSSAGRNLYSNNVFSGNEHAGVHVLYSTESEYTSNYIGENNSGQAFPNKYGFYYENGRYDTLRSNVISNNDSTGITMLVGYRNYIESNLVNNNSVFGVDIKNVSEIFIQDENIISNNGINGIQFDSVTAGVYVLENTIFDNGLKGIDLDNVGNVNKKDPYISSVTDLGSSFILLAASEDSDTLVQFFAGDGTQNARQYLGKATSLGDNLWELVVDKSEVNYSEFLVLSSDDYGTSEFGSLNSCNVVTTTAPEGVGSFYEAIECANFAPDHNNIVFDIGGNVRQNVIVENLPEIIYPISIFGGSDSQPIGFDLSSRDRTIIFDTRSAGSVIEETEFFAQGNTSGITFEGDSVLVKDVNFRGLKTAVFLYSSDYSKFDSCNFYDNETAFSGSFPNTSSYDTIVNCMFYEHSKEVLSFGRLTSWLQLYNNRFFNNAGMIVGGWMQTGFDIQDNVFGVDTLGRVSPNNYLDGTMADLDFGRSDSVIVINNVFCSQGTSLNFSMASYFRAEGNFFGTNEIGDSLHIGGNAIELYSSVSDAVISKNKFGNIDGWAVEGVQLYGSEILDNSFAQSSFGSQSFLTGGVKINGGDIQVESNNFGNILGTAIVLNSVNQVEIIENQFGSFEGNKVSVHGVEISGSDVLLQGNDFIHVDSNSIKANYAYTCEVFNNTILDGTGIVGYFTDTWFNSNAIGVEDDSIDFGISLLPSFRNNFSNNTIITTDSNAIYIGAGSQNKIIENTLLSTEIGINLNESANANNSIAHLPPTITQGAFIDNELILKGTSYEGDSIHVYYNNGVPGNAIEYISKTIVDTEGNWRLTIDEDDLPEESVFKFIATTTTLDSNTSEFSDILTVSNATCYVNTPQDNIEGSLRAAIDSANEGLCNSIEFSISDEEIQLSNELSAIVVPLSIEGANNGISISGDGVGFEVNSEYFSLSDVSLIGFDSAIVQNGDLGTYSSVNVDKSGIPVVVNGDKTSFDDLCVNCSSAEYAEYGVIIYGESNIVDNSRIIQTNNSAIIIDGGTGNTVLSTTTLNVPTVIEHVNAGNTSYESLLDLSADYVGGQASFTGQANIGDVVQIFLSDYTGDDALELAYEFEVTTENWMVQLPSQYIKLTENQFFVVSATSASGNTSEFSTPIILGDNAIYCVVENTDDLGDGSLRAAVECANNAGSGQGVSAFIVFDLPVGETEIPVLSDGFEITNTKGVTVDAEDQGIVIKNAGVSSGFTLSGNRSKFLGMTFDGFEITLIANSSIGHTLNHNTFIDNDTSIKIVNGGGVISNNTFLSGEKAVVSINSNVDIEYNVFGSDSTELGSGIYMLTSHNSDINSNTFNDLIGFDGVAVTIDSSDNVSISNNIVNGLETTSSSILLNRSQGSSLLSNTVRSGLNGIVITGSDHLQVSYNKTDSVSVTGIELINSTFVNLTQNIARGIDSLAKPIELHYGEVSESNEGFGVPVFTNATYKIGELIIRGTALPETVIEVFETSDYDAGLKSYLGSTETDRYGTFEFAMEVAPTDINDRTFKATSTYPFIYLDAEDQSRPYTSETSEAFNPNLKICYVVSASDENVEGTLRYNIHEANAGECNLMLFNITDADKTIDLESELPVITSGELTIDGTSQPNYFNTPLVSLDQGNANNGFTLETDSGGVFIHGLELNGFEYPYVLNRYDYFENSLSVMNDFNQSAYDLNCETAKNTRLISNHYSSSSVDHLILVDRPRLYAEGNEFLGGQNHQVKIQSDSVILFNNEFYPDIEYEIYPVAIDGTDSVVVRNNTFNGFSYGVSVMESNNVQVASNTIDTTSAFSSMIELGVLVESSSKTSVLGNEIASSDTSIVVRQSPNVIVSGNQLRDTVQYLGIHVLNCDSALISSNLIRAKRVGVLLDSSLYSELRSNRIVWHDSVGVIVDSNSHFSWLTNNKIGAENSFQSGVKSSGLGVLVNSSDNIIGGADSSANQIFFNESGGIHVRGVRNRISYNEIFDNDTIDTKPSHFAILHLDSIGNGLKTKPEILTYTVLSEGEYLISGEAQAGDSIHLYRSEGYYQNARYFANAGIADGNGEWEIIVDTADFDDYFENATLTIVATATDAVGNTSELSEIAYIGTCYVSSNLDDVDNDYPKPNTFRQAVACANSQTQSSEILFAIDGSTGFDLFLEREMLSLSTPSGVSFDGANILRENKRSVIIPGYHYEATDTSMFWRIADSVGTSTFENLRIQYFDSAMYFGNNNVVVRNFECAGISDVAYTLKGKSKDFVFDSLLIESSNGGKLFGFGDSVYNVTLSNSEIKSCEYAVHESTIDSLIVRGNKFSATALTPFVVSNSRNIAIIENTFENYDTIPTLLLSESNKVLVRSNSFDRSDSLSVVKIENADSVLVVSNSFANDTKLPLEVIDLKKSAIDSNTFGSVEIAAIVLRSCDSTSLFANTISEIDSIGFDLSNSENILISQNLIGNVVAGAPKLIDNHEGQNEVSNIEKPEPIIEGYKVQLEDPSGECDADSNRLGIYLYGEAEPYDVIEIFFTDSVKTTFTQFIDTTLVDSLGNWEKLIDKSHYQREIETIYSFIATARDSIWNTSEESVPFRFDSISNDLIVDNTANDGPNTLRDVVNKSNCSDIHSMIYFNIENEVGPFTIVLQDSLPVINAYLGITMDAQGTQAIFQEENEITGDYTVNIDASSFADTTSLFVLDQASDWVEFSNFNVINTLQPILIYNGGNKFNSVNLTFDNSIVYGDTAIIDSGSGGNVIDQGTISGYYEGVNLPANSSENTLSNVNFESNRLAIHVDGDATGHIIKGNTFFSDSISVLVDSSRSPNYIIENQFGEVGSPSVNTEIVVKSSVSQFISGNYFPEANTSISDSLIALIYLTDSSSNNQIQLNRFGIDLDGYSMSESNMVPVILRMGQDSARLLNNVISENDMAGLTVPGIVLDGVEGGSISANMIGVDTGYVQREEREDYSTISGIDTTALIINNSAYVLVTGNHIINFTKHGIEAFSSTELNLSKNRIFSEKSGLKAINLYQDTEDSLSNIDVFAPTVDTNDVLSVNRIVIRGSSNHPLSELHLYEGFSFGNEEPAHSSRYIKTVITDATGNWEVELPTANFGFSKYNKYVAQINDGESSSEYSDLYIVKSLLCKLTDNGLELLEDFYDPCPGSQFKIDAQLAGLDYQWVASNGEFETMTDQIVQIDTSAEVTLILQDDFGCEHQEVFDVEYKEKPQEPSFIVSSENYVSDTLVLIDVSYQQPVAYDWSSSDGLSIVEWESLDTLVGPDGKEYPTGREVRFIAPDTGTYTITQRSILNNCFVSLDKEIFVTYKDPTIEDPYELTPGINTLYAYPNPIEAGRNSNLLMTTTSEEEVVLEVIDGSGNLMTSTVLEGKESYNVSLDTETYASGIYVVKLTSVSSVLTYKIMISGNEE